MKRRKFIEISSKGTIAMGVAPVILNSCKKARPDELHPTEGYLRKYSRVHKRQKRSTINLLTDFSKESKIKEWPVTFGVPFPRGAVADINHMRIITGNGDEVPAQITRTATWHSPDGDVKWALVDMTAKQGTGYMIEYGSNVKPASFSSTLQVKESVGEIMIETGPIRVSYDRSRSFLPAGVWLHKGNEVWESALIPERMYMIDNAGVRYTTSDKPEDYKVEVEEKGQARVTVKISGWYRNESGEPLCQYITRINHYAGHAFVKMIHTFIIAFDTDKTQLRDIAIPLRIEGGKIEKATYQVGLGCDAPVKEAPVPGYLIQETADEFILRDMSSNVLHKGKRSGAWVSAMNTNAGLAVGVKNFWQEYPRELETNPDGIVVHLWPLHGEHLLDLGARFQLGPRYKEWDKIYWTNWYVGGLDQYDQAYGLAKTSEIIVAFHLHEKNAAENSRLVAAALEEPPLIHNEPQWVSTTDVFGPIHPRDREKYPKAEQVYDAAWDQFNYERNHIWNHEKHIGNFGFFDFGDVNYHAVINEKERRLEPGAWRRTASRFYGICIMPWLHYVRSTDRRHLRWSIDNARHVMDVDMCHLDSDRKDWKYPKYKGGRYGGNGGIIHYGADVYGIGPDSHMAQWKYFYYLTGDRRAWDMLNEEGEFYLGNEASGVSRLRKSYAHRASGGALCAMVDLWEATWDKRYLEAARDIANTLYAEAERAMDSTTRCDDVYMNPGMIAYYQATGDERMKDLFLNNMRVDAISRIPTGDPRSFTGFGPSIAFYFTGDDSFLNRPLFLMQQYFDDVNLGNDPIYRGTPESRWTMAHNTVQMIYDLYLLKALDEVGKPIKPAGDLAATSGEIWIENPDGNSFTATVFWTVFSRPFYQGLDVVREWPAYVHRNNTKATVSVMDPGGNVVKEMTISYADYVRLPYNSQDYPYTGQLVLDIPAGKPGIYRIVPAETGGAPLKLALINANGRKWGIPTDRGGISHGPAYYFMVPEDLKSVTLKYRFRVSARKAEFRLLDQKDNLIASRVLSGVELQGKDWKEWTVSVPEKRPEGLWRLVITPSLNIQQVLYLQMEGLTPFVSLSAEEYFTPAKIPAPLTSKTHPVPAEISNEVRILTAVDKIKLTRGRALSGKGSYQNIDSSKGTLEFWMKPGWDMKDFQDYILLNWGGMQLVRRSINGMTIGLRKDLYLASGFIMLPDHWYHVAITWDVTAQNPFLRMYINGAKMTATDGIVPSARNTEVTAELPKLGDWTAEEGTLGGAPMSVGGIKISRDPKDQELLTDKKYLPLA